MAFDKCWDFNIEHCKGDLRPRFSLGSDGHFKVKVPKVGIVTFHPIIVAGIWTVNHIFSTNHVGTHGLALGGDRHQLVRACSRSSPSKGGNSHWGASNFRNSWFGNTYRFRPTQNGSNTINSCRWQHRSRLSFLKLQPFTSHSSNMRARDLWCLHELAHCILKTIMNCIIACKWCNWLLLDDLTP